MNRTHCNLMKTLLAVPLVGLLLTSCVQSHSSTSRISAPSLESPIKDSYYTEWAQKILPGMEVKRLLKEKGKPDVISIDEGNTEIYYFWYEREHIPVYVQNSVVTKIGIPVQH